MPRRCIDRLGKTVEKKCFLQKRHGPTIESSSLVDLPEKSKLLSNLTVELLALADWPVFDELQGEQEDRPPSDGE